MNDERQHDLNDELLSAYLDDELSAEERALVESRLTADPTARQMLEQLRHISQTVRGLPQEKVGRDLRETILRRVEATKAGAQSATSTSDSAAKQHIDSLPTFTIGRTRRGWIWASLAVAAGLLIMFTQSDSPDDNDLRMVAQPNREESLSKVDRGREPASMTAGPEAEPLAGSLATSREMAEGTPATAPMAIDETSGLAATDSFDSLAEAPSEPPATELGLSADMATPPREPNGSADDEQLVVVRVLAKPAAIENKAFDKLLVSNGIALDAEQSNGQAGGLANRVQAPAPLSRAAEADSAAVAAAAADNESNVDVVLVDAPPSAIYSCLEELNRDSTNYAGVAIEDVPDNQESASTTAPTKKLAFDLNKYNRGIVPPQQQRLFAGDKDSYRYYAKEDRYGGGLGGTANGDVGALKSKLGEVRKSENLSNQARARRLHSYAENSGPVDKIAGAGASGQDFSTSDAFELRQLQRQLKTPANDDNMQVWFLLSPSDAAAASLETENRAE